LSFNKVTLIITLCLTATILWFSDNLAKTRQTESFEAIDDSLIAASNAIEYYISSRRNIMEIYTKVRVKTLETLLSNNADDKTIQDVEATMANELKSSMGEYYAFVTRREDGHFTPDEFDETIGELCRQDMEHYLNDNKSIIYSDNSNEKDYLTYKPFLHPNPVKYHFDLISPWQDTQGKIHLFSFLFDTKSIVDILKTYTKSQHQLVILKKNTEALIEINETGDRSQLGENIRLNETQLAHLYGRKNIKNTLWDIAAIVDEKVSSNYKKYFLEIAAPGIIVLWIMFGLIVLQKKTED